MSAENNDKRNKVESCAREILQDKELLRHLEKVAFNVDVSHVAGNVAGLLWVLPIKDAAKLYKERTAFERAVATFKSAVETYERRTEDVLPTPSTILYRRLPEEMTEREVRVLPTIEMEDFLDELGGHVFNAEGGTWVHDLLATEKWQWPRTDTSAAEVWIIRSLELAGARVGSDEQRAAFLEAALRLSGTINEYAPKEITATRKTLQNHPAFKALQKNQKIWAD